MDTQASTTSASNTEELSNRVTTVPKDKMEQLAETKLLLEIAELRRSPWIKPTIVVPIAVTVATLAVSQYLGVFDLQRTRIEVANREAVIAKRDLDSEIASLQSGKKQLSIERDSLEEQKNTIRDEIVALKTSAKQADEAASRSAASERAAKKEYERVYIQSEQLILDNIAVRLDMCGSDVDLGDNFRSSLPESEAVEKSIKESIDNCFKSHMSKVRWPNSLRLDDRRRIAESADQAREDFGNAAKSYLIFALAVPSSTPRKEANDIYSKNLGKYYIARQEILRKLRAGTRF